MNGSKPVVGANIQSRYQSNQRVPNSIKTPQLPRVQKYKQLTLEVRVYSVAIRGMLQHAEEKYIIKVCVGYKSVF